MRRQPSATQRTASPLAAKARAGSLSQASTAVQAAQCTTASGRTVVIADEHRVAVGHVERCPVGGDDLVARGPEVADDGETDLAGRAGDEDPHAYPAGAIAARARSGSHHERWSRYQATVASSASSSCRCGRQPSASTFSVVIE